MLALAMVVVAAACGDDEANEGDAVEVTPQEPKPSVPESPTTDASVGEDASAPATPITAPFDGGADASADDAAAEEPCPPVGTTPSTGARYAFAVRSRPSVPKVLDGDLADFRRCVAIRLDSASAARTKGTTVTNANVYLEWEPNALWLGADIGDVVVEGDDIVRPFMNDSLEVYISGAGLRTGDYGPLDHQYVVDHAGRAKEYASAHTVGPFTSAMAAKTPTGYRVEMRIDASAFSTAPLAKGDVKFLNVMLNDGIGQAAYLLWAMQPHTSCSCTTCACNTTPAFDTLLFAPITLR
jgi:hypothetical protein